MDKLKGFLSKSGPFGVPVYAYAIGLLALVGGVWYFKTHSAAANAQDTAASQTNYPSNKTPLPYPDPGGGAAGVPPSSAFDLPNSGSSIPQFASQANFYSPPPADTSSQTFATTAVPTIFDTRADLGGSVQPPQATQEQITAIYKIPFIGPIISRLTAASPPNPYQNLALNQQVSHSGGRVV